MYNFKSHFLHASLGLLALGAASGASAQSLFSATEHAISGQPIVLTGTGFDPSTTLTLRKYAYNGTPGPFVSLPVTSQTALTLGATIPSNAGFGVYRIEASSASGLGGNILVNTPVIKWANLSQAAPGSTVRLVGRNLRPGGSLTTTVRLVDTATGISLPATVNRFTDYDVTFQVPATALVGHIYSMFANSGLAGQVSEVPVPTTLTIQAAGTDPFNLGTPWGSEFASIASKVYNVKTDPRLALHAVGDGVADDAPAIQAAILYASQWGGGTVYLPAGTYNVDDGKTVNIYTKVVLKGDGAGTTLCMGYRFTPTVAPSGNYPLVFAGGVNNGMTNLTVQNVNGNASPNYLMGAGGGTNTSHIFITNVNFQLGNGKALSMGRIRGGIVNGNTFMSTSLSDGPINFNGARDLTFSNNNANWRCGRVRLCLNARDIIENNFFQVDNSDYGSLAETGGFETSSSQDLFISANQFQGYGTRTNLKEGEMVMAQRSVVQDYWATGLVLSATSTTLTQGLSWGGSWLASGYSDLDRSFVVITRGTGAGQLRRVTAHDTNSLTVDRPWTVAPDATSTFAVGTFTALDQTIVGNTMTNEEFGVMFYDGAVDCTVASNVMTNCGPIWLRSDAQPDPRNLGLLSQCFSWNNTIRGNYIKTTDTLTAACISITTDITPPAALIGSMGSLSLQNTISDNNISGSNYYRNQTNFKYDGIEVVNINEMGLPWDPIANLGYNVQWNNTITGSLKPYNLP